MVKYISSYDKISTIILSVTTSAVLASMAILLSSNTSADSTSANATVTVGSACTMTATVNTAHTAEVPAGSTKTDIGSTTLNTICNDAGGYAIYAVGYSGDEYGNNKMINGTNEINTGTGSSASNWNISLSQVTTGTYATTIDGGFGSYSAIPATYTKVAHRDSVTDSTTGSSINLTYGAYVASTQAPGDYVGKVKFTMVHPATEVPLAPQQATPGYINYFPNGRGVVGTMGSQSATDNASLELLASNFSRTGYGFAGWSDAYDYATNPSAHFYGPQETITAPEGTTANGLSLYAVWVKSQGSIQDTSKVASVCNSLTTAPTDGTANLSSVSALTDQRDNNTYAIAKLADSNCWMIENLRLESTAEHNSDGTLAEGYGISATYGNFGGLAGAESSNFTSSTTANSLYYSGTQSGTASINIGTTNSPGYRMPRYNNINTSTRATNPTSNTFPNNNTTGGMYSYGNYYTWHAAIADTTIYYSGDHGTTSLCPTGWRLPIGNQSTANKSFGLLSVALNGPANGAKADSNSTPNGVIISNSFRSYPNNFIYSGIIAGSSIWDRGSCGRYWSSTTESNSTNSFALYLTDTYVYPGTNALSDVNGLTIRCILKN